MNNDRKALWPWIVAVLIGLPVLYVASFGPACWVTSWTRQGYEAVPVVYRPIVWIWNHSPPAVGIALDWYARVGADPEWTWLLDEWAW